MTSTEETAPSIWLQWAKLIGFMLLLLCPPLVVIWLVSPAFAVKVAFPYALFGSSMLMMTIFVGLLWLWQARGAPVRWLAVGWALAMWLFALMIQGAVLYTAFHFRVIEAGDMIAIFSIGTVGTLVSAIGYYITMLPRLTAQAAKNVSVHFQ